MQTKHIDRLSELKPSISPKVPEAEDRIEELQLHRLANAVLCKSQVDLAALAEANPLIVWEWIEEFRRRKNESEQQVRYWSAAMAALSTATPQAVSTAAE